MAKSKTREKIYFSFLSLAVILVTAELYNSRLVVLRNRSLSNDDHEAQAYMASFSFCQQAKLSSRGVVAER